MTHFLFSNIYNSIQNYNFERDILGDVNDDGIVNILDIVMIINFIMGEGTLTVESAGDINNDEIINILDVVLLVDCIIDSDACEFVDILDIPQYVTDYLGEMPNSEDNQLSEEGIDLGRFLFYDTKLSGDNTQSCASCHIQENGFTDPNQFSEGITGEFGSRNAMQIINAGWFPSLFWDGRSESLEEQALNPVVNPIELNTTWLEVIDRIEADSMYAPLFDAAFGSSIIDSTTITNAIAQFERTLLSFNSKYDDYFYGDFTGFTDSEENGFDIYFSERGDCIHCHSGPLLTDNTFRNNGLDLEFSDLGLGEITGNSEDNGKFKVPTLRNIEYTAPYMHDGRFSTLEEVIEHYNSGVHSDSPNLDSEMENAALGLNLTEQEKIDLINFIKTFSDPEFISNPEFSDPFDR